MILGKFVSWVVDTIRKEREESERYVIEQRMRMAELAKHCNSCKDHVCLDCSGWCPTMEEVDDAVRKNLSAESGT